MINWQLLTHVPNSYTALPQFCSGGTKQKCGAIRLSGEGLWTAQTQINMAPHRMETMQYARYTNYGDEDVRSLAFRNCPDFSPGIKAKHFHLICLSDG